MDTHQGSGSSASNAGAMAQSIPSGLSFDAWWHVCSLLCTYCQDTNPNKVDGSVISCGRLFRVSGEEMDGRLRLLAVLCRTSKTLREAATPHLYHSVYLRGNPTPLFHRLVKTVSSRPQLANYVKYILFDGPPSDENPDSAISVNQPLTSMLSDIAASSGVTLPHGWPEMTVWKYELFLLGLLVANTPNVKGMRIWLDDQQEGGTFQAIWMMLYPPAGPRLQGLKELIIGGGPCPKVLRLDITRLISAATNLRTLSLECNQLIINPYAVPNLGSVTSLSFHGNIRLASVALIVRACGPLEVFHIDLGYGCSFGVEIGHIGLVVGALQQHRETLKTLGLRDFFGTVSRPPRANGDITALQEFGELEYLFITARLFKRDWKGGLVDSEADDAEYDTDDDPHEYEEDPPLWEPDLNPCPNLVEMLPRSAKELHFADEVTVDFLEGLKLLLAAVDQGEFDELREIVLYHRRDSHDPLAAMRDDIQRRFGEYNSGSIVRYTTLPAEYEKRVGKVRGGEVATCVHGSDDHSLGFPGPGDV
ncbi:hypothetical protein OQA88_10586 [Cercophora sp. LCS_1]